jgi:hypothetical protein
MGGYGYSGTTTTTMIPIRKHRAGFVVQLVPAGTPPPPGAFDAVMIREQVVVRYGVDRPGAPASTSPTAPATVAAATGPGNLNGTDAGDITATVRGQTFGMRLSFTLVQGGDQITGTWNTTSGASGTFGLGWGPEPPSPRAYSVRILSAHSTRLNPTRS